MIGIGQAAEKWFGREVTLNRWVTLEGGRHRRSILAVESKRTSMVCRSHEREVIATARS